MTSGSAESTPFQFRTYQCAHCRIFFPETTDYSRFLSDGLNLLESDNPFKQKITIFQALAQIYGHGSSNLLNPPNPPLLTQDDLCLCETCESELRILFRLFVKFGKKENSLLIQNCWGNDVPNRRRTDFVPNEEQGECILGVASDNDDGGSLDITNVDEKPELMETSNDITGWRILQKPSPRSRQLVNPFSIVSSKTELQKKFQDSDPNFAFVKLDTTERVLADETLTRVTQLSAKSKESNEFKTKPILSSSVDKIVEEGDDDVIFIANVHPCVDPKYQQELNNKSQPKNIRPLKRRAEPWANKLKKKKKKYRKPYPSWWKCHVEGCKEEAFATQAMLFKHKLSAHNISRDNTFRQKFTCTFPDCGKTFLQKYNYLRHRNTHLPPEERVELPKRPLNFKCEFPGCEKAFSGRSCLSLHSNIHLPPEQRKMDFPCPQCGKGFASSNKLKIHIRIHTDERSSLCTDCGKSFRTNGALKQHMETHKAVRKHICQDCGKGFNFPSKLLTHRAATHSEDRPFTCEHCGKSYKTMLQLRAHQSRTCGGEQNPARYACDICNWACKNASLLQQHRLTHAPDYGRLSVCQTCKQSFLSEEELAVHEELHKDVNKCVGPGCKESFKTRVDLRYHLLEFHQLDKQKVYDWVKDPTVKLFE